LTGYTVISRNLPGLHEGTAAQTFAKIMNEAIAYNWFFWISGCCTVGAAIAAYMSTADSALMAASSMVTLDFVRDYFMPALPDKASADDIEYNTMNKNQEQRLYLVAKISSVVFGAFAVYTTTWDIVLKELYVIQGTILMLACPAYFFGMYFKKTTTMAINMGLIVGVILFIALYSAGTELPDVWAVIGNIAVVLLFTYVPQLNRLWWNGMFTGQLVKDKPVYDPDLDTTFLGFRTTLDQRIVGYDLASVGGPALEPIKPWWINFIVYLCLFIAIPFWQNIPSSYEDTSFSGAMPTWAVNSTFFAAVAMTINVFQTYYNWSDWIQDDGPEHVHHVKLDGKWMDVSGPVNMSELELQERSYEAGETPKITSDADTTKGSEANVLI